MGTRPASHPPPRFTRTAPYFEKIRHALLPRFLQPSSPLAPLLRPYFPVVPLVGILGMGTGLLEGIGITTLVPLVALLLSDGAPDDVPDPLLWLSSFAARYGPETRVVALGGVVLGLVLLKGLMQASYNIVVDRTDARIGHDLRTELAGRMLTADYALFLNYEPDKLEQILSHHSWAVSDGVRAAFATVPATAALAIFALMLGWLEWRLLMIALAGAAIIQVLLLLIEWRNRRLSFEATAKNIALGVRMMEVMSGRRTIRVFGQERRELARFAESSAIVRDAMEHKGRISSLVTPAVDVVIILVFISILLFAVTHDVSLALVVAFLILLARAQPHAYTISQSRNAFAAISGAIGRVEWLLRQEPAARHQRSLAAPAVPIATIRFDHVSYTYPGRIATVEDLVLTIPEGEATALIGPSGSGKTTVVNLITGLIAPTRGAILLGGQDQAHVDPRRMRDRMALAGQDTNLISGTIADNIAYARQDAPHDAIVEAAVAAGADGFISRLDAGYATVVGPEGLMLSGGQRQRIALARALLRKPDLLILDEPTSSLDPAGEAVIARLLAERRFFRTALVISHRHSTLAGCTHGIAMENGCIAEEGPLQDLAYYRFMALGACD